MAILIFYVYIYIYIKTYIDGNVVYEILKVSNSIFDDLSIYFKDVTSLFYYFRFSW